MGEALPEYLTEAEAARIVRRSPRTLKDYRVRGGGPKFLRAGRTPLYTEADLRTWLEECARRAEERTETRLGA